MSDAAAGIAALVPPAARASGAGEGALVCAQGLTVRYGKGTAILDGLDIAVNGGEAVALIGPNGAGKSTLLKAIVGLLPIGAGSISVLGETFTRRPGPWQRHALRRQLGFVFQHHGLVRRATALSNVVHGALGQGNGFTAWHQAIAPADLRRRAFDTLARVGLAHKAMTRADRLSGGQSQRVAIARALVRRPRLLIADEPAASLDPAAGDEVMSLFRALAAEQGITLIFTSHDMEHALRYADRVVALKGGRLVIDAPSRDLDRTRLDRVFE